MRTSWNGWRRKCWRRNSGSQECNKKFGPVAVVQLEDVAADGLVMPICGIGAPTISFEMLNNGGEAHLLRQEVQRVFNKPVVAIMASEIGGSNGAEPVMWASRLGLPIVDAVTNGRAIACRRAIEAGADPQIVEVVDQTETPLSYLSSPTVRIIIKAAGPLGQL